MPKEKRPLDTRVQRLLECAPMLKISLEALFSTIGLSGHLEGVATVGGPRDGARKVRACESVALASVKADFRGGGRAGASIDAS